MPNPRQGPAENPWWSALLLPAIALALVVVGLHAAAAVRQLAHGMTAEEALRAAQLDPLNVALVQAAAFGVALVVGVLAFQRGRPVRRAMALEPVSAAAVLMAVVAGMALQFPLAELGNLAHELAPQTVEEQLARRGMITPHDGWSALSIIAGVVIVAPASEELLFRGLLLPGLAERYGAPVALVLTSLAFGLMHVNPVAVSYAAVAGVVLGAIALRTGSTFVPVAVHAGVNSVPLLLPERLIRIDGFNTISPDVYHLPVPLLLGTGLLAAASLLVVARLTDPPISR